MSIFQTIKNMKRVFHNLNRQNYEMLWAKTWDDTKKGIAWIEDLQGISPGRWAVGYNFLYIMTRILNELEPHSVLDLGLGISSTLFSCYFSKNYYDDSIHTIIEQDESWVNFYTKKHKLSESSEIFIRKCVTKQHNGMDYYAYEDFDAAVKGKQYSVISIDAPWGSDRYSRRDIIDVLPGILTKSFVIVMDDTNRRGEKDTIEEIEKVLQENNIQFCKGEYPSLTDCTVIASKNNSFLCTL